MANIHKLNPHDINNRDKNMNITIDEASRKLRLLLDEAVRRNLTDGILLSGGLDTSVLAKVASEYVSLKAFTVAFKNTPAPDVEYAKSIAAHLGLKHTTHYFDENELYHAISAVIKTMKSFDPHVIRNSAPLFIGLTLAGEEGSNNVMTGEGCDELFAGYPYLYELEREQLRLELHKLWKIGIFPEIDLAKSLGMQVKLPYLDPKLVSFAMDLDPDLKVREEKGDKNGENGSFAKLSKIRCRRGLFGGKRWVQSLVQEQPVSPAFSIQGYRTWNLRGRKKSTLMRMEWSLEPRNNYSIMRFSSPR